MTDTRYAEVRFESLANEVAEPLGDALPLVVEAGTAHAARIARESRAYQPLSSAERGARERLQVAAQRGAPADEELGSLVRDAYASHYLLRDMGEDSLELPNYGVVTSTDTADIGMWWWGQTSWWTPGHLLGLTAFAQSDGVHFRGQLDYDDGDLWFGSAGVTAIYGIGSDRLPPAGWYRSAPRVNLWGEVWGFTGVNGPLSFGDNWSKCWLHANQKIMTEGGAIIAQNHWFDTLLFFDSDGLHGVRGLPGSFTFPEVFVHVLPDRPLVAELELKFDIQLEGSSAFRFGNYAGWTEALFQASQWPLVP
ncbi:hypothetical protein ACI8AF_12250 [Blastococcus sp. SYSU D00669]